MKLGSLFSGIEGFGLGFERAGFEVVWQVEREPFCIAVLKTHFPNVERYYEIKDCGRDRKHKLGAVDVITAGFPCQDLSVAGKRAGLAGSRSGLFWELARILGELRPPWIVIENVPGLFSSNGGEDFAAVLRELGDIGYGLAWRVLDSQYFGVAQRRRRVFIVGSFGKPCPQEVLFESEGGEGDFAESGETWPGIAGPLGGGAYGAGRRTEDDQNYVACVGSLQSHSKRHGHAMSTQQAAESGQLIAFDTTQITSRENRSNPQPGDPCHPLAAGAHAPAVAFALREDPGGIGQGWNTNFAVAATLNSGGNNGGFRTEPGEHLVSAPADSIGMRDFAELPEGMDSPRYRALGNAVTANVAQWIAARIKAQLLG